MEFKELYEIAKGVVKPHKINDCVDVGGVGAAIVTPSGNVHTGVCIDTACSMGFCAEHAAIAAMITAGEYEIEKIIAVGWEGVIMPPCGRCSEFISQLQENCVTQVMVAEDTVVTIKEILPYNWKK